MVRRLARMVARGVALGAVVYAAMQFAIRVIDGIGTGFTLMEIFAAVPRGGPYLAHWSSGLILMIVGWLLLLYLDWQAHAKALPTPIKLLDARGNEIQRGIRFPLPRARRLFVRACIAGIGAAVWKIT